MQLSTALILLELSFLVCPAETAYVRNANHVFNAIQNSMRQFGSSLNHNGMSAFLATVPKGTQLYHGTDRSGRVNETEWLAFEPEHALVFARPARPPPDNGPPEERKPHSDAGVVDQLEQDTEYSLDSRGVLDNIRDAHRQMPLSIEHENPEGIRYGYLHSYETKHDLRLLYLDGQSAAKTEKGTLDMQDIVLLHGNPPRRDEPGPSRITRGPGPMGEYERALKLCTLAEKQWSNRIDGFIRMELGFEIILCSFSKHLQINRIAAVERSPERSGDEFSLYQAVASRFDGIGGGRVKLDYNHFLTLFESQALYFDDKDFPRVRNETSLVQPVLNFLKEMILHAEGNDVTDWQTVIDMIVLRYSDRIEYLSSSRVKSMDDFKMEVQNTFRPYINQAHRNLSEEIERCAAQFIPQAANVDGLAAKTIVNITTTICSSLYQSSHQDSLDRAVGVMQDLKSWLAWPAWKRCRGCDAHEVCFLPIWPLGGQEHFDHPACVSDLKDVGRGYWENPPWSQ